MEQKSLELQRGDIVEITSQRDERSKNRRYHYIPVGSEAEIVMLPEDDPDCQGAYDLKSPDCNFRNLVFERHFKKI